MPGKLPIRRKGGCLPALCLVGFVFFVGVYAILCQKGLPDCALREIERRAAEEGVTLTLGNIRLAPAKFALRADDVHVEIPLNEELPPAALDIRKIKVDFPLLKLISGKQRPAALHLPEFSINIPVSEDKAAQPLHLSKFSAVLTWENDDRDIRLRTRGNLNDIDLDVQVACTEADPLTPLQELATDFNEVAAAFGKRGTEGETPEEPEKAATQIPKLLNDIRDTIAAQHWAEDNRPDLKIDLNLLAPSPVISVSGHIPTYELGPCQLCDIAAEAEYREKALTIHRAAFRTVEPEAALTLQAGFDFNNHELNLQLKGNAAVARLAMALAEEATPKVITNARVGRENLPEIDIEAYMVFGEGYAVDCIRNYQLKADIRQKGLQLCREETEDGSEPQSSRIDELYLSFLLHDGGISIHPIQVKLPGGELKAQVSVKDGTDTGSGSLSVHAPTEEIIRLLKNAELLTEQDLQGVHPEGMLDATLNVGMNVPLFVPGKTKLSDLVPDFSKVELDISLGKLSAESFEIDTPKLTLTLAEPELEKHGISAKHLGAALTTPHFHISTPPFSAREDDANLELELTDIRLNADELTIAEALLKAALGRHQAEWQAEGDTEAQTASADGLRLSTALSELAVPLTSDAASRPPTVGTADLSLTCEHSAMGEQEISGLELTLEKLRHLRLEPTPAAIPAEGTLNLKLAAFRPAENALISDTILNIAHAGEAADKLSLSLASRINDGELSCHGDISVRETPAANGTSVYRLNLSDCHAKLPVAALGQLPWLSEYSCAELKHPQVAELRLRELDAALAAGSSPDFRIAGLSLHIPELTRCPQQTVLRGQDITIGVDINADIRTAENDNILYNGTADITHESGQAQLQFNGDAQQRVTITGRNTITADVIDRLIDDEDAHYIIRDFRFTPGVSMVKADNISTVIDWSNGLVISAHCDADIRDTEYLLMSMEDEEDAEGHLLRETLRKDMGDNPYTLFKHATCGVEVRVALDRRDSKGNTIPDETLIILSDPVLTYDNRPWLKRAGISNGAKESTITGREVKFDIEACTLTLTDISGDAYPTYAFGTFYPDLHIFMKDVHLQQPAQVSTHSCVFPIALSCQVPMSGTIRALSENGASYSIIGTEIPLNHFSGYITLSDTAVYLSKLNAMSWEGALNADINIGFAKGKTSFNGRVRADALNISPVADSYGVKLSHGLGEGQILFTSPSAELRDLKAHGSVTIRDGELLELGVFESVRDLITNLPSYVMMLEKKEKAAAAAAKPKEEKGFFSWLFSYGFTDATSQIPFTNYILRYGLSDAHADFRIEQGKLNIKDAKISGCNLQLRADASLDLDTVAIESGSIRPTIFGVSTQLLRAFTALSAHHIITIDISGPLQGIKWRTRFLTGEKDRAPVLHSEEYKKEQSE